MLINPDWLNDNTAYTPSQIDDVIAKVRDVCAYTKQGSVKYLNIPFSFDTETSSFYDGYGDKVAIMYVWMLGICGLVVMGRTWDEWEYVYNRLVYNFRTCGKRRILIYIHNISFDFNFIRKHHNFDKVFATDRYQPLYAITEEGIEFRCSYRLSGYSLDKLAQNLHHHKIKKLLGELDYRQIRHTQTPLTDEEKHYCLNDVKIVNAYIDELIDREGVISNIPLTKTGFVRRLCRKACFENVNYKISIHNMKLTAKQFSLCKDGFQGGFTHNNPIYTNEILEDIYSEDITSSYPESLFDDPYPMESPKEVHPQTYTEFYNYLQNYCCIIKIGFTDIRPKKWYDFYISASKCEIHGKHITSNGRIVSADEIITTITNVDFDIINYMYKWDYDKLDIYEMLIFKRDYLPTPFVKSLIELYQKKTELKGVEGKEVEYSVTKQNQNSFYGMTVTSPVKDIYNYNGEWLPPETPDLDDAIEHYNNNHNRFLYYVWGVFCTAYARRNIWKAIIECGDDYVYCDTDSIKFKNFSAHAEFFKRYNKEIEEKHRRACKAHGIPFEMCNPKNIKGENKLLGAFEIDGIYDKFKTLGAKRYLYKRGDKYGLVVAGLGKSGLTYLLNKYGDDIFEHFDDGMTIPAEYSGRLTHTYIDEKRQGVVTDLYGNTCEYCELSGVHLEPATFTLGMAGEFIRFITQMKEGEYV